MNIDVVLANSVKLQCHVSEIAQVALPFAWILVRYMCMYACRCIGMLLHFTKTNLVTKLIVIGLGVVFH